MRHHQIRTAAAALGLLSAPVLTACVTYLPAAPPPQPITVPAPAVPYQVPPSNSVHTTGCVASYETAQSSVDICGSAGSLYYYGSSDSGSITLRAYLSGNGYTTESNDGHVYHVDHTALTITRDGTTLSSQPVIASSGG
ncbi:hypothetical protein [Saccharopolyspora dendranthemae]|uniref:Uncharacterized protein n=1 Tax=Saccharopolyspora dendranthemae TaxID=1181886 RepID=A0A561U9T0_9PSEU|nr:hypothetical protein [Saccharopolyspora dendranthemae]TWF96114.1 hypothetical protein FHU35_121115 [Saccharopolyspora dendranthemae]